MLGRAFRFSFVEKIVDGFVVNLQHGSLEFIRPPVKGQLAEEKMNTLNKFTVLFELGETQEEATQGKQTCKNSTIFYFLPFGLHLGGRLEYLLDASRDHPHGLIVVVVGSFHSIGLAGSGLPVGEHAHAVRCNRIKIIETKAHID